MRPTPITARLLALAFAALAAGLPAAARADCSQLWSNDWSNVTIGPSQVTPSTDTEVADDFDLEASIERIIVEGYGPSCCLPPAVQGVRVRFYSWTASGPGTLLSEQFLTAGDPNLAIHPFPNRIDIILPTPFAATGPHFFSVQVVFAEEANWSFWQGNPNAPDLSPVFFRDNGAGGAWGPYLDFQGNVVNSDVNFQLYGTPAGGGPPQDERWSWVPTPNPSSASNLLRSIAATGPDDAWAVGRWGNDSPTDPETYGLTMHWDGATWSVVSSPNPSPYPGGTSVEIHAVAALAPDDVWAGGTQLKQHPDGFLGFQTFVLHWDGSEWTEVPSPLTPDGSSGAWVSDIVALAPDDIWFVGERVWDALAMHWDGSDFTIHSTPEPGAGTPGFGLEAVAALAPDDIWAVGGGSDGDWGAFSYIIHWDGSAWSHVPGPEVGIQQRYFDVEAIAPNDVWASGAAMDGVGVPPVVQHWDGTQWSDVAAPSGGGGIAALASDDVWMAAAGGFVHWDGASWSEVPALGCVPDPAIAEIEPIPGGGLWGAGRQIRATLEPLAVRFDGSVALTLFADGFESGDLSAWSQTQP